VRPRGWAQAAAGLGAEVVVATVPAGAGDDLAAAVPGALPGTALLVDVRYDPWPTPLAAAWGRAGGDVAGGRELLVGQAVEQVRLMTGEPVPAQVLLAALEA